MSALTIAPAHRPGTKIALIKSELDRLHNRRGSLTPQAVVEAAKKKDSPLHDHFTWDNSKAAQKFRLLEAAFLIRTVRVNVSYGEETHRAPAYLLPVRGESSYRQTQDVMGNAELSVAMLDLARAELGAFRKRFGTLHALAGLMSAIDKTLDDLGPPSPG
jgi:hypothetical protein